VKNLMPHIKMYLKADTTLQKGSSKIRLQELIRSRKELKDNLNLPYDSVRIDKIKKYVLACQSVTTS
jgi:hypothetical protein